MNLTDYLFIIARFKPQTQKCYVMISENPIKDDILHMLTSGATRHRSHFEGKTRGRLKGKIKMCLF